MKGPSPFGNFADGIMDELTCRIVAANVQGLVVQCVYMSPACDRAGTRLLGRDRIS